ncbi:hypothetical protein G9A89_022275 [Geosiphon pyriformis]|nr:hypothetical protein G9A89_022275 [Geosiphon pyriformis]
MKEVKKKLLSGSAMVDSFFRKKHKDGLLVELIKVVDITASGASDDAVESISEDTTEFKSVNMEKEYLVKETSFQVVIKHILGKPLGTINFDMKNDDILDGSISLPPLFSLKHTVQVLVRKSFALNINLGVVADKSSQEKLAYVKKIFSGVNGFGGASTPLKFGEIIQASFISKKAIMAVAKLANDHGVVINTDLKHPINNCMNWTIVLKKIPMRTSVETKAIVKLDDQIQADFLVSKWSILIEKNAVYVAKADIDKQTWDARDIYRALLFTLPMEMTAHDLWNFISFMGGKTCVINHNPVNYTHVYCVIVCFESELDLDNAIATTSVIKRVSLCWFCLLLALCLVYKNSGHMSLACKLVKVGSILRGRKAPLSAQDQFRLAKIYDKKSAPIFCSLAFMVGISFTGSFRGTHFFLGSIDDNKPLPSGLAKRLDFLILAVSQPSPGCQLLVILSLQNLENDIVIEVGSSETTSSEAATVLDSSMSPYVIKLENMLKGLSAFVLSLSA